MGIKFSNFARAKLATPPSGTSGLSFTVEAGKGALFPTYAGGDYSYVCFKNSSGTREIVKVEARAGDAFTISSAGRGLDGTAAYGSWSVNDYVEMALPTIALLEIIAASDAVAASIAAHLADTSDAHDASAISYAGGTGLVATDVEAAIDELATEKRNEADDVLLAAGKVIVFEGATDDAYEATLTTADPTADRVHTLPDLSGSIAHKAGAGSPGEVLVVAVSDESTAITTGTAKVTFRMPFAMTLTAVRATLSVASSSGTPTFDINEGGVSVLSTKITIDANEKTSTTAAVPPVISDASLADDAEITIDIDVAGTGAKGAKVCLIGYRT